MHEWAGLNEGKYLSEMDDRGWAKWFSTLASVTHKHGKTYGDISLDHIHNLDYWLGQRDVTLICLMRDRDETVDSIMNYKTQRIWERLFPQFDFTDGESVGEFWDWYYETILEHEDKFIIISPDQLDIVENKGEIWQNRRT